MESQATRRRMKMIAAHFAAKNDIYAIATHIFPMNCSSSLNSVIQRRDNRTNFARQGSSSQAYFTRPVSPEQLEQDITSGQSSMPLKCIDSSIERFGKSCEEPLFSRPVVSDFKLSAPEPPRFSRECVEKIYSAPRTIYMLLSLLLKWSPKTDIGEYGRNYVIVVELPGVSTKDIRVEVNDKSMIVKGNLSTELWKLASRSNDSISAYHKREILQGPYQIVWPLPNNVDKDNVSAEFVGGLLRITIPKL